MTNEVGPEIRLAKPKTLNLFTISDSELDAVALGGSSSIKLTLCIFFLSISAAFFIALKTTIIQAQNTLIGFCVTVIVGLILGVFFLCIWLYSFITSTNLVKEIKKRLPPEGSQNTKEGQ